MIDLAKLRLSRVLMAEHKYEQALALLKAIKKSPYYGLINVTIGDLYVAMGNNKQAIIFYNRAHTYLETSGITHVFLDMKIEQLKEEG
jgi:predicted negative regulator of RcsB-dependent stress response